LVRSLTLPEVSSWSADEARTLFSKRIVGRWPVLRHCAETDRITKFEGLRASCFASIGKRCGKQVTATVGTLLEDSHLRSEHGWVFRVLCWREGVSALQLQRQRVNRVRIGRRAMAKKNRINTPCPKTLHCL